MSKQTFKKAVREAIKESEGVADTIWKQISIGTKMSVGARRPVGGGNKLHFNVGRGKRQKIEVTYNPGQDLYTVKFWKFDRDFHGKVVKQRDRVYAEDLNEVIYGMVNK